MTERISEYFRISLFSSKSISAFSIIQSSKIGPKLALNISIILLLFPLTILVKR